MPYITQEKRRPIDEHLIELAELIRNSHEVNKDRNGLMNYSFSKLISIVYGPNWRYADINDVVGLLTCVDFEFYDKVALPYERKKELENGPVY